MRACKFCIRSDLPESRSDDVKDSIYIPNDCSEKNIIKVLHKTWNLPKCNMVLSCHSGMRHPRHLASSSLCETEDFANWRDQAVKQIIFSEERAKLRKKMTKKQKSYKDNLVNNVQNPDHPLVRFRRTDSGFSSSESGESSSDEEFEYDEQIDMETNDANNEENIISKLLFERLLRMYVAVIDDRDYDVLAG